MSLIEITNKEIWDQSVVSLGGNFGQSFSYGSWQECLDRNVVRFFYEGSTSEVKCLVQLISFSFGGKFLYWYSPYGPVATKNFSTQDFINFKNEVTSFIKKLFPLTVFIRLEHFVSPDIQKNFPKVSLRCACGSYMQPRLEWVLPLEKTEEELLMGMHQKARYSVRLAEKRGVVVEKIEKNLLVHLEDFMNLINETAERNGFKAHEKKYFEGIFTSIEKEESGFLLKGSYEGEVLVMDLVFCFGDAATYLFGGSNELHRDVCAPYLLKWQGIVEAKRRGMKRYSFGAISDLEKKENMQWEGITNFKVRFGGEKLRHGDFFDIVLKPFWYYLYMTRKFLLSFKK